MITQRLMKLGSWSLVLSDSSLKDEIEYFEHVVIVPGELRQPDVLGDASILSIARYAGIIRSKKVRGSGDEDTLELSGQGPEGWLGDEDGRGFVYESERVYTADTFANVINRASSVFGLLRDAAGDPTAILAGTINSVAGTYTGSHVFVNQRTAIRYVCDVFGAEYRVNPDFTLDAGEAVDLFVTAPTTVVARKITDGRDPNFDGIPLSDFEAFLDVNDYTTRTIVLAEGTGDTLITGEADAASVPYLDPQGNAVVRVQTVNEAETESVNATTRAQLHQDASGVLRKGLTLSPTDYDVEGDVGVGDTVYLWDPTDAALIDTANEIRFRGSVLNPIAIRVLGVSWPVTRGMAVYIRHGDGSYTDVTDSVIFETGDTKLEVGANPRSGSDGASGQVVSGRVNTDPDGNDTTIPDQPAHSGTPWGTSNYQDSEGRTRSQIVVAWTQPLNTDASTITDGSHYVVRWRRNGESDYQTSAVPFGTLTFLLQDLAPGVTYEISVAAYDVNANSNGFAADESVVASADVTAPSTPAVAVVAGNPINVQVEHELGVSGGGTFNLEADLDHLNVYISTSSGFTPSAANLAGMIEANNGHLTLGIKVIGTFEILDTTTRFVKVTAVDRAGNESTPSAQASVSAILIATAHISDLTVAKLTGGTIATTDITVASSLIIGTGGLMESANYVAGSAGWHIDDDDAEFNDVVVRGDVESGNWDGASPATIGTLPDQTAQLGFYVDSSLGSAQFMGDLYVGNELASGAQLFIDNTLHHLNLRDNTDAAYPDHVFIMDVAAAVGRLFWFDAGGPSDVQVIQMDKDGTVTIVTGPLVVTGGSVSDAAVQPATDPNTGIFFSTADQISFAAGGVEMLKLIESTNDQVLVGPSGIAGAPSLSQLGDEDTGIYWPTADTISISAGGVEMLRLVETTSDQLLIGPGGTNSAPSLSQIGDPNTGIYFPTGDTISIAAGGVELLRLVESTNDQVLMGPGGVVGAPVFSQVLDPNTGIYFPSGDQLAIAVGGVLAATFGISGTSQDVQFGSGGEGKSHIADSAGSASLPTYSFANDANTGIYRPAADQFGFATGGAEKFKLANNQWLANNQGSGTAPILSWSADSDTGIWRPASDVLGLTAGGADTFRIDGNKDIYIPQNLPNVGNVNNAKFNRTGGTGLVQLGYDASWVIDPVTGKKAKKNIVPIGKLSTWWDREWFLDLTPIKYERVHGPKSGPGKTAFVDEPIEMGFSIENLIEHTNLLTVGGVNVGDSPDERAILAVTVDYVQHLEKRLAVLEAAA